MPVRAALPVLTFLAAIMLLQGAARAVEVGYPTMIAGQLASAMELSREDGKALEGVALTVELDLDPSGRVVGAAIVAVENARTPQDGQRARAALEQAINQFRDTPFQGFDPDDHATWGYMRVRFQLGVHVGGYQP